MWTHPESPLQVALINYTDIALTLFYLSWQNPVLPAPQTLVWYQGRLNKVLVVAGGQLFHWPLELQTLTNLDFQPGTKDLGPSSSGLKPSSLEVCLERFLVSSFYRLLAMNSNSGFFDYIGQTSCQDGLIAIQRQVGCVVLQNLFLG